MEKKELQRKGNENTINSIAKKLELKSKTKMVTKKVVLNKLVAKDVVESKFIDVAGQMFFEK